MSNSEKLSYFLNKAKKLADNNFNNKIRVAILSSFTINGLEESLAEQHQRNALERGLNNSSDNDLILLSDADEIPNLNKLNMVDKTTYPICYVYQVSGK